MPRTAVIDLSHHNVIPVSLQPARDAGVVGVIHKLTQGTGFADDKCASRRYLAGDAGLLWGVYHFLEPGSIRAQADHFLTTAEKLDVFDAETLIAVDHEDYQGTHASLAELGEFLTYVEDGFGCSPVIYSGHVLKEQLAGNPWEWADAYRLWLAQYASAPTLPSGFEEYWLWQFTDEGTVPGINGNVDCNDYTGTDVELAAEWAGREVPAPTPLPPMPVAPIIVSGPATFLVKITEGASLTILPEP